MADKGGPGAQQPGDAKNTAERLSDTMKSGPEGMKKSAEGAVNQAKESATKATDSASKATGMGRWFNWIHKRYSADTSSRPEVILPYSASSVVVRDLGFKD
ncbi:hypothetical protein LOZ53_003629 [Ophidiomyces ophidiicola]|nr:hypothetical protein LOZ55_004043 [Ophidiomyces ophidiicola]KAI1989223.1 hypothetical protein LOZ53_003629 [Ophidiomyces ophidiicola]KAI1994583.1 hypothetical protein LOZ51_003779 [Ophidiomyces ophidiicola]